MVCYRSTFASAATVATSSWQRRSYANHCRPRSRYLGYIDADVSVRSHVTKTVSGCFTVLRQLRTVRRSVSRSVFQSLAVSLVLSRLDHGNATFSGIPQYLLRRLQSVMNSAARGTTTPLRSISCTGLRRRRESISSLLLKLKVKN